MHTHRECITQRGTSKLLVTGSPFLPSSNSWEFPLNAAPSSVFKYHCLSRVHMCPFSLQGSCFLNFLPLLWTITTWVATLLPQCCLDSRKKEGSWPRFYYCWTSYLALHKISILRCSQMSYLNISISKSFS